MIGATTETQIAEWRSYVAGAAAVNGQDVDELEAHLRDQIEELGAAGLASDEAFLIAVKRMGDLDALSREFAREHRGRLWKQLVLGGDDQAPTTHTGWLQALAFAVAAGLAIQVVRLAVGFPEDVAPWLARNLGFFVVPFLASYFAHRRQLGARGWLITAVPFVVLAFVANLFPYRPDSVTEILVAVHLPVLLWFLVAYPYVSGEIGSHERRMDFVRFTGEWVIYYALIALGGAVLMGLTVLILEPLGADVAETVIEWVLPSGAAGAVIIAAWLVESKQRVVENMAPVLTMLFTPLFALMLTIAAITYSVSGAASGFDRELLGVFDGLLVVVLGLVLYAMSAREPARAAGPMDYVQLLAVVSALALDLMVLTAMLVRIGDLGFTPNRVAALGLNLVLLVNLAGTAWFCTQFLRGRTPFHHLERWQTSYFPVFAAWVASVIVVVPLLFAFR